MNVKMPMIAALNVLAVAGGLAIASAAQISPRKPIQQPGQDLTLHETTTSSGSAAGMAHRATSSTSYFGRKAMRRSSPQGIDTIIRVDQGRIITINHKEKTFSSITIEQTNREIEKAASEITEDKVQMDAVKKAMSSAMGSFVVSKIGPGEPIAGYKTVRYAVKGIMQMEIWAAPELEVPPLYYDALKMSVTTNPIFDIRKMLDEFKKIEGMTLKTIQTLKLGDAEITSITTVDSVKRAPLPASVFEIPAGYKEVAADPFK